MYILCQDTGCSSVVWSAAQSAPAAVSAVPAGDGPGQGGHRGPACIAGGAGRVNTVQAQSCDRAGTSIHKRFDGRLLPHGLLRAARQLATLLSTLAFGLDEADTEVVQASLEALAAFARFHAASMAAGGPGVPQANGTSSSCVFTGLSAHVLIFTERVECAPSSFVARFSCYV